jgi:hypothetical protein
MKKIFLTSFFMFSSLLSAEVLDFNRLGKTGSYCPGQTLSLDFEEGPKYVERLLISAEGIRRDGFIKVYADGVFVHNIGVPGYDPDYSFRVRRVVKNISFKFEQTCSRILDGKIFTPSSTRPNDYRSYQSNSQNPKWGLEFLKIFQSLSVDLQSEPDFYTRLWPNILLPLKKLSLSASASENTRDPRSQMTALYALQLAEVILENQPFLDRLLFSGKYDFLVLDLLNMKEDILERYDVSPSQIKTEIESLKNDLN